MSDQKKPTDSGSTESTATEEPGKELDADQLENVSGGQRGEAIEGVFKFFRPNPTGDAATGIDGIKEALPTESLSLNFKK